uniref:Uncharacterized protein n=1 Tax=Anopheles darlingi TaxID=43151 RepID=A0A2M4CWE8_ANODA
MQPLLPLSKLLAIPLLLLPILLLLLLLLLPPLLLSSLPLSTTLVLLLLLPILWLQMLLRALRRLLPRTKRPWLAQLPIVLLQCSTLQQQVLLAQRVAVLRSVVMAPAAVA